MLTIFACVCLGKVSFWLISFDAQLCLKKNLEGNIVTMDGKNIHKFEKIPYIQRKLRKIEKTTFLQANAGKNGFVYLESKKPWRAEIVHVHIFFELRERCIATILSKKDLCRGFLYQNKSTKVSTLQQQHDYYYRDNLIKCERAMLSFFDRN